MLVLLPVFALASDVTVELVPVETSYRIGEPLWMELVVHNDGDEVLNATFYPRFTSQPIEVEAVGPRGQRAIDPYHARISPVSWGVHETKVPPRQVGTVRFDLARYAWLDVPGTWTVRVRHPLGSGAWTSAEVVLVAPTEAEARAIVDALPRTREAQVRDEPKIGWESLGHPVYVPILEPLAATSLPTEHGPLWSGPNRTDERALLGLAACPCPEATAALLRLYDALPHPELRRRITQELRVADALVGRRRDPDPPEARPGARVRGARVGRGPRGGCPRPRSCRARGLDGHTHDRVGM